MRYEIQGTPLPVAICYLESGESMITERGSMSWMSPNMAMETNAGGQSIVLDTGYLAAMDASCNMEIRQVPGLKNKILGGEGFLNTVVTGPGRVYIQTMPINKVAGAITPYIPTSSN